MEIGNHKEGVCKIACVVVTYNRKTLLERCLNAIRKQTYKPTTVYLIDNASTDGTDAFLLSSGYVNRNVDDILFKYYRCEKNEGGAGGFYKGMKTAHEDADYEGIWVMDDDGEPDKDCLKELVPYLKERDYIAPLVLSDEDRTTCSFIPNATFPEIAKKYESSGGVIEGWASPFNGILYSTRLVKKIGYPKKKMFIWGDEINYQIRAEKAGFHRMTIVKAVHYHPVNRLEGVCNADTLNVAIAVTDINWKLYCYIRNCTYNTMLEYPNKYLAFKKCFLLYKSYINYYKVMLGNNSKVSLITDAFLSGVFGYFGGMRKYWKR